MRKLPMTAITLSTALAGAIALGTTSIAAQAAGDKVNCYGVAKAGENDCASKMSGHSCAGMSKVNFSGRDFKAVSKDECMQMQGKMEPFEGMNPAKKG